MNNQNKRVINLFIRYILILILGLWDLILFYYIFTPLTITIVYNILSIFSKTILIQNMIIFNSHIIELIPACIAGAAYYLLLLLILSTPDIKIIKRIKIILFSFFLLFILNIFRILILTLTLNTIYFKSLHLIFWYIISTIFVFATWIVTIKLFKIKKIPVASDIKFLYSLISANKTKKQKKKPSKTKNKKSKRRKKSKTKT